MEIDNEENNVQLRRIFQQPLENNPSEQRVNYQIQLCRYLSLKDLKALRTVNSFCHKFVSLSPSFGSKVNCKISERWHREFAGTHNLSDGTLWHYFTMERFAYHRRHALFHIYWKSSSKQLVELTISKSSMECDGLSFIMNECINLKSINFYNVKLKHWSPRGSLIHLSIPVLAGNQYGFDTLQTIRMRQSFKSIRINKVDHISSCIFSYFKNRSGSLESLHIEDCLNRLPNIHNATVEELTQAHGLIYDNFMTNLVLLLTANRVTLNKLELRNLDQMTLVLSGLVNESTAGRPLEGIRIQDLCLTLKLNEDPDVLPEENEQARVEQIQAIHAFINTCVHLEKLELKFISSFTLQELRQIVFGSLGSLKYLKLILDGSKRNNVEENVMVNLSPVFEGFQLLETVEIVDSKEVNGQMINIARGEKAGRREALPLPEEVNNAKEIVKTPLVPNFVHSLPATIREFSLNSVRFFENESTDLHKFKETAWHRLLTKLEIIGPLISSIKHFELIPRNMTRLKSLSMINCGLSDAIITGLSPIATHEMRKTGINTYLMLANRNGDKWETLESKSGQKVQNLIDNAKMYDAIHIHQNQNARRRAHPGAIEHLNQEDDFESDEENQVLEAMDAMDFNDQNDLDLDNNEVENENNEVEMFEAAEPALFAAANNQQNGGGDQNENENEVVNNNRSHISMLKELEHLDLSKNYGVTDITVFDSIKNPTLKVMKLDGCPRITDATLDMISRFHPNLQELHVKGCRRLTKYGFNQVVEGCPKIQRIFTTKKIALDDIPSFVFPLSSNYFDVVRYPEVDTRRVIPPVPVEVVQDGPDQMQMA